MTSVLVVDDDCDNRALLAAILNRAGYRVFVANDGPAARRVLSDHPVDAALLDVRISAESGLDLCRELRAGPATAALPVMLVTAYGDANHVSDGYLAGADDYVVKPFRRKDLLSRLRALLVVASTTSATAPAGSPAILQLSGANA